MLNKSTSLSKQVSQLTTKQALLFLMSIPHQDDWGRVTNDPDVFKATVAPLRRDVSVRDCAEAMDRFVSIGLAYLLSDCLEYTGFEAHQTLNKEKRANSKFSGKPQESPIISDNPQESPVQEKGSKGKGGEGNRRKLGRAPFYSDPNFQGFWDAYPLKRGKGDAWKSWEGLGGSEDLAAQILKSVSAYKGSRDWTKDGGRYVPYPATFLNRRMFDDGYEGEVPKGTWMDREFERTERMLHDNPRGKVRRLSADPA